MLAEFINTLRNGFIEEEEFEDEIEQEEKVVPYPKIRGRKDNTTHSGEQSAGNLVICQPKRMEDVKEIIDYLMEGNSVTINLEKTVEKEKQRILDMVSGYCYSHKSNIVKVNSNIVMVSHLDIQSK